MKTFSITLSSKTLLLLLLLFSVSSTLHAQQRENLTFDGKNRSMIVYTPKNLPENAPLVITLHGFNQSAQYQMEHTKWNTVADTAKFVVVYPDYEGGWWDVNSTKDTRFIEHIMQLMNQRYSIDLNRVYVSGFSLGAMMTYHCIEVLANKVAAFAPVSGVRFDNKAPVSPRVVPIIHTHCKGDDVFKWEGDPQHASGGYPYIPDYVKSWAQYFGMNATPEFIDPYPANKTNSEADLTIYRSDDSVAEVRLLSIDGAGHWHVDNDIYGGVSTTQEIWNFCKRYTLNLKEQEPPVLIKAEPEDCSFDLPDTQREFALTLDRPAWKNQLTAKLVGNDKTIQLQLKETEAPEEAMTANPTFVVPEDATITTGDYTLTLEGVCASEYFTRSYSLEYSYGYEETGDQLNVETIFEQDWDKAYNQNGEQLPEGWQRVSTKTDGTTETITATDNAGEGSRLKYIWEYGDITTGLYLTARDLQSCSMNYGRVAGNYLNLPLGKYVLSFNSAYWDKGSQRTKATFDVSVVSKSNRGGVKTVVKDTELSSADCVEQGGKQPVSATANHSYTFKIEKKDNYVLTFDISKPKVAVCIGQLKITTAPTNADKYKGEFLRIMQTAKNCYEAAQQTTLTPEEEKELDNLKAIIDKYEGLTSTAPSVYTAAIAEIQAAMKSFSPQPTTIGTVTSSSTPVAIQYFTIDGRQASASENRIAIRRTVYKDGKVVVEKLLK